jgi:hypothetical protein
MKLSKEAIDEFKQIYKEKFGKDIGDAEALESATKLINLMRIIYKPMTKAEYDKVQEERREAGLV